MTTFRPVPSRRNGVENAARVFKMNRLNPKRVAPEANSLSTNIPNATTTSAGSSPGVSDRNRPILAPQPPAVSDAEDSDRGASNARNPHHRGR